LVAAREAAQGPGAADRRRRPGGLRAMTVAEAQLETFVAEVVDTIEAYGPPVLGAYILGSALLGGFDPRSSDLDLVAVVGRRLTSSERSAVTHALVAPPPPGP